MAEQIICPQCKKESFTAAPYAYLPCPHCGQSFSIHGVDKRQHPRVHREVTFSLNLGNETTPAKTIDISRSGIGVSLEGPYNIAVGKILNIYVPELGIDSRAEVMWHKTLKTDVDAETRLGVKIL